MNTWIDIGGGVKYLVLPSGRWIIVESDGQVSVVESPMAINPIEGDSKSEPNYDDGQWYRITFFNPRSYVGEEVFTQGGDSYVTQEVRNQMKSKGYTHYHCDPRVQGKWCATFARAFGEPDCL